MIHDIFISYTRDDELWAAKLQANLKARNFTIFRDVTRLNAGDEWEPTLRDAIVDSRTLVVLWSNRAAQSKWVMREQEAFRQMMHVDTRKGAPSERRMLQVCLEGANPEYPAFQTVADVAHAAAYAAGADQINANVWNRVLEKVELAARLSANLPIVHQVILASTRDRMQALADDSKAVEDAIEFSQLIKSLDFCSKQDLVERYGDHAGEWRPFGGQKSIVTLMSELREELIARGAAPFLWKPVSDEQWPGVANKRALSERLLSEACVIVLDAISLYDSDIRDRYDWLVPCLDNPKAAIAVLPPYSSTKRDCLRTVLEAAAAKMFDPFYRPDKAQVPISANCSVLADDPYEVSRLVAAMVRTAFRRERNPSLRFGPRAGK